MDERTVAVIVPARDEASTIGRCLRGLAAQEVSARVIVVVAVNGSRDDTEAIVRRFVEEAHDTLSERGFVVEVVTVPEASKIRALNAADAVCKDAEVRIYLDADVALSPGALASMADHLVTEKPKLVAPSRRAEEGVSPWSRAVGSALCSLPWVAEDIACGGVFATNAPGRARWGDFPPVGAEDAFVFGHFAPDEREVLQDCSATHPVPETFMGILRQQRRWQAARDALMDSPYRPQRTSGWPLARRVRALGRAPKAIVALAVVRSVRLCALLLPAAAGEDAWHPDRGPRGGREG